MFIWQILIIITATLLGLGMGSFINVIVLRTKAAETILGRSHCVACRNQLAWFELIPVLSFLGLRGQCRHCRVSIAWQYPVVEGGTAITFALLAGWYNADLLRLGIYCVYAVLLVIIFTYDLKYYLILDRFTLPGIIIAVLGSLMLGMSWLNLLLGMLVGLGVFLAQFVVSNGRWIGAGDIRLGALMGAMVGWPQILVALFIAYMLGAVVAVGLIFVGKKKWNDQLPFGTFLSLATFITLLTGQSILNWYLHGLLHL